MILKPYDRSFSYRPLDILTLDTMLFLAYDKHWKLKETTPVKMVSLALSNTYNFVDTPYPKWTTVQQDRLSMDWFNKVETIDLQHVADSGLYFIHWRLGWREKAEELVVGYDRNDEYVHIERRDVFRQSR